ncbi:phosphotyrosine-specific ptp2-like protein [Sorochytrium milnesiophthora]
MCAVSSSSPISSDVLAELLRKHQPLASHHTHHHLLIIDVRPPAAYAALHITSSINLCIPSTLVKRPSFTFDKAISTIPGPEDMAKLRDWRMYSHIVLCGSSSDLRSSAGSVVTSVADKIKRDATQSTPTPQYLSCAVEQFVSACPDLTSGMSTKVPPSMPPTPPSPNVNGVPFAHPPLPSSLANATARPVLHLSGSGSGAAAVSRANHVETLSKPNFKAKRPSALRLNLTSGSKGGLGSPATNPLIKQKFDCRLHLLSTTGVNDLPGTAPDWFRDLFKSGGVISELQAKFQTIQLSKYSNSTVSATAAEDSAAAAQTAKKKDVSVGVAASNKNRYCNIWPFEYNRVKLQNRSPLVHPSDSKSDYINASFISPPMSSARYIATQAPLPHTIPDFWQMVWDQNSRIIINLTPDSELESSRTHLYWPLTDAPLLINQHYHSIKLLDEHRISGPIMHKRLQFLDQESGASRQVSLVTFSDWEDADTPPDVGSVLQLLSFVNSLCSDYDGQVAQEARDRGDCSTDVTSGPMVIHCSAGCGRTGTFITIRTVLHHLRLDAAIKDIWRKPISHPTIPSSPSATPSSMFPPSVPHHHGANGLLTVPPTPTTLRLPHALGQKPGSAFVTTPSEERSRDMYSYMSKPTHHTISSLSQGSGRAFLPIQSPFLKDNHCFNFSPAETIDSFYTCRSRSPSPLMSPVPRSPALSFTSALTSSTSSVSPRQEFSLAISQKGSAPFASPHGQIHSGSTPTPVALATSATPKMNGFFDYFMLDSQPAASAKSSLLPPPLSKPHESTMAVDTTAVAAEDHSSSNSSDVAMSDAPGNSALLPTASMAAGDDRNDFIFVLVKALREQRVSMVQTAKQYLFCYEVLLYVLAHFSAATTEPSQMRTD